MNETASDKPHNISQATAAQFNDKIGRTVFYETERGPRPAVIVFVRAHNVDLFVMDQAGSVNARFVEFDAEKKLGTWRWTPAE